MPPRVSQRVTIMSDDFKNAPRTIGEIRAERDDDAGAWSARDALIKLLRDIDDGKINVKSCVIVYRPDDDNQTLYLRASDSFVKDIGMLEAAKFQLFSQMGDAPNE